MLFVLVTMLLESSATPVGLTAVKATANETKMSIEGRFEASGTIPVLVWPRKATWENPCRKSADLCCMRDLLLDYRNDELQRQQGPKCLTGLTGNLVTGSRQGVTMQSPNTFTALVPLDTPFVAMMFVHLDPFYVLDGVQTFSIRQDGTVEMSAIVKHAPCHNVEVPGKPFRVCMQCNNILKANARFIYTPTWYVDYTCEWKCNDGFVIDSNPLDPQCVGSHTEVPLMIIIIAASAVVVAVLLVLLLCFFLRKPVAPPPEVAEQPVKSAEIIQFRENTITPMHIRVKMN